MSPGAGLSLHHPPGLQVAICPDAADPKLVLVADNSSRQVAIMIRTQISLSEEEHAAAKREAARIGVSLAELLRRPLRAMLAVDESRPWMRHAGLVESADPRSSQRTDELIHGEKP
jgi:hypothetical protein